jgi:hypothetical protein
MFHYTLMTRDPASSLARLLELLDGEGLRLENFKVREASDGEHEVSLSVVASVTENGRLIVKLHGLGTQLTASTHEE